MSDHALQGRMHPGGLFTSRLHSVLDIFAHTLAFALDSLGFPGMCAACYTADVYFIARNMIAFRLFLAAMWTALMLSGQPAFSQESSPGPGAAPPASCPVTRRPENEFRPPVPYKRDEKSYWFGTEKLWTRLSDRGIWQTHFSAPDPSKPVPQIDVLWMSVNQNWQLELHPDLKVKGRRLDGPSPRMLATPAFRSYKESTEAMQTGVVIFFPGCWEITGEYKGSTLTFVVWVEEFNQPTK